MRTERWASAFVLVLCCALAACVTSVGRRGGLSSEHIARLPPEVADSYEVFSRRCSRCHTLARPLAANVTDIRHWRVYVTRMRRNPGSGISPADAETILKFLGYWVVERERDPDEGSGGGQ